MQITKLVDEIGDDVFAFALVAAKSFDGAREIFAKTFLDSDKITDSDIIFSAVRAAYPICREAECNDEAATLTGIELNGGQEAVLSEVLAKPQIMRMIIHMTYENDLTPKQIASVTGESERYIQGQLDELSPEMLAALDKYYKEICAKICADDSLKAYVVRAAQRGDKRPFEVREEAIPSHVWTKRQKLIVVIIAIVVTVLVCIVIPLSEAYRQMQKDLEGVSYTEVPTDEIFAYTTEAEPIKPQRGQ